METTENSNNTMVFVENLNVIFGDTQIVQDVSFNVEEGEIIGMFGISGAGNLNFWLIDSFNCINSIICNRVRCTLNQAFWIIHVHNIGV